ncbi:DegQ family serine endoprotease [Stagnimonas aquatica]|uniref:DegQ family serine endoprotease n=1 Tax=Stagnimonas aquatica TaxID=2689987 RepID=A0A3N0VKN1_9GAMM|nr:DegQ family serine endoprotease [Stagnimonas aquatica]ROH93327.1 DegQ family serine endoprotease [Stagnimonas aquatica]
MSRNSLLKSSLAAAAVGFGVTAAVLSLSTTAPQPAHADLPAPMIAAPSTGGLPSLAPMLREVMPAVVNISVTSKVEVQNPFGPMMDDPNFRRFFGIPDQPQQRQAQSLGSGTIVDAAKGYILTNNHVVADADEIKVRLSDDREFAAKLIGKDADTDLAVIQIKAERLKALSLGNSDGLQVGDFVVAIGSPFGLRQTATTGIVSGLGRATGDGIQDFIQTDASINPGNSGGALINLRGELVGVPSQILSRSGGNIGIGFAIPVNLAKSVMNQLIETGTVTRGRIGVQGQDLTPELAKSFGLSNARGVVVSRVVPDGPAARAGLKVEDIILKANGREITDFNQLRTVIGLLRVGEKVQLDILREGKPRTVTVAVGKDSEQAAPGAAVNPRLQGATFAPADESNAEGDIRGVVVAKIDPRSPAARTGLRQGDVIIGVNRRPVNSMDDFAKLTAGKDELLLHLRRGESALFLIVQ